MNYKLLIESYSFGTSHSKQEIGLLSLELETQNMNINKSTDDPKRATVIFQGPENVLCDIFMNPETKPIVEASGHIYAGTKITRWIS